MAVRTYPLGQASTFKGMEKIIDVQKTFLLDILPNEQHNRLYLPRYTKLVKPNNTILFQCANHIIGTAEVVSEGRFDEPLNGEFNGFILLKNILVFAPIALDELQTIYGEDYPKFMHAKQFTNTKWCFEGHLDELNALIEEKLVEPLKELSIHSNRNYTAYASFRKSVLERDEHTCQCCGVQSNLVVHHLESYANNPELRCEPSNGVTLCSECHKDFHHLYGYGKNTTEQYNSWIGALK